MDMGGLNVIDVWEKEKFGVTVHGEEPPKENVCSAMAEVVIGNGLPLGYFLLSRLVGLFLRHWSFKFKQNDINKSRIFMVGHGQNIIQLLSP